MADVSKLNGYDIKDAVARESIDSLEAQDIFFDNDIRGVLQVTDVQSAIDELTDRSTSTSAQIANKADKTALALTDKKLQYLSDLTKGKVWTEEAGTTPAYQHTVESGAKAVAINGIGGKTIVYNQQLDTSHITTLTDNGITCTRNNNGTLTLNGTATGSAFFSVVNSSAGLKLVLQHTYLLIGCPSGGSWGTYLLYGAATDTGNGTIFVPTSTTATMYVFVGSGATLTNVIFTPQLIDLTAMGATSSDVSSVANAKAFLLTQGIDADVYNAYSAGELVSADVTSVVSKDEDDVTLGSFSIPQNGEHTAFKNAYPMLSNGSTQDWIDIENKKYTSNIYDVDLGSLNWGKGNTTTDGKGDIFYTTGLTSIIKANSNFLCSKFVSHFVGVWESLTANEGSVTDTWLILAPPVGTYSTADAFKTAMNGIHLYCEKATATETDISSYFTDDNLLTVEANGTLTFVQSDTSKNIYVPNDTVYAVQLSDAT